MSSDVIPSRVLVVAAHPDDIEYYCGGTLAYWAVTGCDVALVIATAGDKGSPNPQANMRKLGQTRQAEARSGASALGVHDVTFLEFLDGELAYADRRALTGYIVHHIRRWRPDVVLTFDPLVRFRTEHPDHRIIGELTRDACYPLSSAPLCFSECSDNYQPWQPAYLWQFATDAPNHAVDISQTIEQKIAALQKHACQATTFGDTAALVRRVAQQVGQSYAYTAAEDFLIIPLTNAAASIQKTQKAAQGA